LLLALSSTAALAQLFPAKPVRIVVPYAPGGAVDNVARIVAAHMSRTLGQPVVIDNKPGASGVVGSLAVANAAADGYTLLLGAGGALTINVHLLDKKPYDLLHDFEPISMVAINDGILIVNQSFPANSLGEFIELVRSSPGKFAYATSGVGGPTHLGAELLKSMARIDMVHIPYSGGDGVGVKDVIAGHVPSMFTVLAAVSPYIKSGQIRPIAALGRHRFRQLPDLPTAAESGYPEFSAGAWNALFARGGTPAAIVQVLNDATRKALADPQVREQLLRLGSEPMASSPIELAAYVKDEYDKWGRLIRSIGLKAQ
jgi:tripartite-type tricarboxylate transporter receptor subunit TctC